MIAEDLINHMLPPLKGTDDAHKAIVWMEEFRCAYMPVVDEEKLLGFISEEIILETNDIEKQVKDFDLVGQNCYVHLDTHFYDILKIAANNKLQMVGRPKSGPNLLRGNHYSRYAYVFRPDCCCSAARWNSGSVYEPY
jgi:hypothetical protein